MKMTFGRKFWACLFGNIVLIGTLIVAMKLVPSSITPLVMTTYGGFIMFLDTAYIGGNVFNAWTKSAHFHPELMEK